MFFSYKTIARGFLPFFALPRGFSTDGSRASRREWRRAAHHGDATRHIPALYVQPHADQSVPDDASREGRDGCVRVRSRHSRVGARKHRLRGHGAGSAVRERRGASERAVRHLRQCVEIVQRAHGRDRAAPDSGAVQPNVRQANHRRARRHRAKAGPVAERWRIRVRNRDDDHFCLT